jgi:hypothetical protein
MSRTDTHLDGMLRHLGAAYYDSLHGRASQADVSRAVDSIAEHFNEDARFSAGAGTTPRVAHESRTGQDAGVHVWSRRVGGVDGVVDRLCQPVTHPESAPPPQAS